MNLVFFTMSVIRSHSLSIGIVGVPNAGKSTLFNALTKCAVPAENFPFCTIDKNIGVVKIPDSRLDRLSDFFKAQKVVPSAIKFVDIAGLVKGASQGEGLGNQFLSHIREVDMILYVLRAFGGEKVVHVYDRIDPLDDLKIVESELILKDIETVTKRIADLERMTKSGLSDDVKAKLDICHKIMDQFAKGRSAVELSFPEEYQDFIYEMSLLTNKRRMYLLNIRDGVDESQLQKWEEDIRAYVTQEEKDAIIKLDVKLLGEMSEMDDATKSEYIEMLGYQPFTVQDLISAAIKELGLITFYTGSEKECNAWSINDGATVKEAAGVIHTDLEQRFITADVVNVDALVQAGGWVQAKEKGLIRNQGKGYIVNDGDYIIIYNS